MFKNLAKKSTYLLVLLAFLVFSNHCLLKDACAYSAKSKEAPCHQESGTSKKDSSQHSSCCDQSCCAPALQSSSNFLSLGSAIESLSPTLTNYSFEIEVNSCILVSSGIKATAIGPPAKSNLLLSDLSLAPNAPPVLI